MAAGANDVEVRFGATIDDFKSKMGEVQSIFGKVAERWVALTAVVAGGSAFKEFIDHANRVNVEAEKMSRTLGITAEEAGAIAAAVADVGAEMGNGSASAETYSGAFLKFNRMLRNSSDEMKKMGVDVDALKNGQKTSNEVFQEALKIVGEYKPGIDQTQAAMRLFGRSVDDVQLLMKVNSEKIEETRQKMVALNRTITNEGIAAAKNYRMAMNDVGDVLEGFKKTVGEGVMPMFTEMATKLASIGPALIEATIYAVDTTIEIWRTLSDAVSVVATAIMESVSTIAEAVTSAFGGESIGAMEVFKNALRLVAAAFTAFSTGVQVIATFVSSQVRALVAVFVGFAEVADRAMHLDWEGTKAAWRRGMAESARIQSEGFDKMVQLAAKGREAMDKALLGGPAPTPKTPAGGPEGKGTKKFEIKDPNADAVAAAQLALERAQTQASLALQLEYLRQYQAIYDGAYADGLITAKDYFDAKLRLESVATDAAIAAKRKELEDVKKLEARADKPQAKLQFQAQEASLLGQINVLEAKRSDLVRANTAEYEKAEQARVDALDAIAAARKKGGADADIASTRSAMEQDLALRRINAEQAFEIQRGLEERSYAATIEALKARGAAIHGTEGEAQKQREQLYAEAEAAEREHQQRLTDISNAAERERLKYSLQAQEGVQGGFREMVAGALNGMTKIGDLVRNFAMSVTNTFVNLIAQKFTDKLFDATGANAAIDKMVSFFTDGISSIVTKWFGAEQAKTAASVSGAATRKTVAVAESATKTTAEAAATTAVVAGQATQTAATVAGASVRTTTEVAAAATSTSASLGSSIANIGAKAWEAAAAVYAAIAAIPVVGPFLAPAAAFAAGAVVLGFVGKIASSEGGEYQVAQDRLNIVHKDETILPAPFAQGLRELIGKGGVTPMMGAIDQIVEQLAPDKRQTPAPAGADPAPRRTTQEAAAQIQASQDKSLLGAPVPADAATSLVLAPTRGGDTAQPAPERAAQVAATGQATTPAQERQTAKSLSAAELPTQVGLQAPEIPRDAKPATTPDQDVGKLVIRWMGEEQNKPLAEGKEALSKFQTIAAGQPAPQPWWRVPASPLGRIQAAASDGAGAGSIVSELAAQQGAPGAAPVQLVGASAGEFFIANRKQLLKVLADSGRDRRGPSS